MKNNKPNASEYVYGNVAYDYEKQRKIEREKAPLEVPKTKKSKKKLKKSKVKAKLKLLGAVGIVFVMSFIAVGRYTAILALSTDIRAQRNQVATLQKENQNIGVELAKLNNLKAIEADAINKYNMVEPNKENIFFVGVTPINIKGTNEKKESALTTIQRILGLIY